MIEKISVVLIAVIVLCLVMSLPAYLLWNWLITDIFNLREITLFEAFGLIILSSIVFKPFNNNK